MNDLISVAVRVRVHCTGRHLGSISCYKLRDIFEVRWKKHAKKQALKQSKVR